MIAASIKLSRYVCCRFRFPSLYCQVVQEHVESHMLWIVVRRVFRSQILREFLVYSKERVGKSRDISTDIDK